MIRALRCWMLTGERDFKCAMIDQGHAEAYVRRSASDLRVQLHTMISLWEHEQIAAEQFEAGRLAGIAQCQPATFGNLAASDQTS